MSAILNEESVKQIKKLFDHGLVEPVEVTLYTSPLAGDGDAEAFTKEFLHGLTEIDPRIHVEERDLDSTAFERGITVSPSIVIGGDKGYNIEFQGAPSGYEASSLLETLVLVSTGESGLSKSSLEKLSHLDKEVLLFSFVTSSCPHCPRSVLQNHQLAIAAPGKVRSVAINAADNLELARKFNVSAVPQQVINEDNLSATIGVQPERKYIEQVLTYGASRWEELKQEIAQQEATAEKLTDNPDFPLKITDNNFHAAIQKYDFLVVDCWAEWCGPCRMLGPIIEELARDQQGRMVFGKLDTQHNQEVPDEYEIHSIPTMLVFKKGELAERIVGAMPKPALKKRLEALL